MEQMIDLMRRSAVPAKMMRAAALGSLSLPLGETLQILVYLASHAVYGEQARMTLAGWDPAACLAALSDPLTPVEVLDYFLAAENRRPALIPALLESSSVVDPKLMQMARTCSKEYVQKLLASPRVRSSPRILYALTKNRNLQELDEAAVESTLSQVGDYTPENDQALLDFEVSGYMAEHAAEIQAAEGFPFFLYGWSTDEQAEVSATLPAVRFGKASISTAAARALGQAGQKEEIEVRLSAVQRIARMRVGDRIHLAMKGTREERFVLVRDGAKVVSNAVLESPKLTESEVELFAAMKNVQENVLRGIAMKRKFMKRYNVLRILTANPRCPMDISLPLLKRLLTADLRHLSMNRNVADLVKNTADKLYRRRLEERR